MPLSQCQIIRLSRLSGDGWMREEWFYERVHHQIVLPTIQIVLPTIK